MAPLRSAGGAGGAATLVAAGPPGRLAHRLACAGALGRGTLAGRALPARAPCAGALTCGALAGRTVGVGGLGTTTSAAGAGALLITATAF